VIEREGLLETVLGLDPIMEPGAGIVDQHIDLGFGFHDGGSDTLNLMKARQVGEMHGMAGVGCGAAKSAQCRLGSGRISRHEHDSGPSPGQFLGRRLADTGRPARDHHGLALHHTVPPLKSWPLPSRQCGAGWIGRRPPRQCRHLHCAMNVRP